MDTLKGKNSVVTGASSGIGRSIALSLARAGANVVIADIDPVGADAVRDEVRTLGTNSVAVTTDVSLEADVAQLAQTAYSEFGSIEVLVANAGVTLRPFRAFWDAETEDFRWVMNVNFWGVFNCFHTFVPRMRMTPGPKHLVATSSIASLVGVAGHSPYVTSKAAIDGFIRSVRPELRKLDIGVTQLLPGTMTTRLATSERLRPENDRSEARSIVPWESYLSASELAERNALSYRTKIDPDIMGPKVVDAIIGDKPYVLTHEPPMAELRQDLDDLNDAYWSGSS